MQEEQKRLFDALAEIKRAAFTRIQERRASEWKLTLSIWSGLAGLTVIMLEKPEAVRGLARLPPWSIIAAGIVLLALQLSFLAAIAKGHDTDRDEALEASRKMATIAGVTEPKDHPQKGKLLDWSRRVQFGMSVMLVAMLVGLWLVGR